MRKTLSVVLSALMILSLLCLGISAADAKTVSTADEFLAMAPEGTYTLTADITLTKSYEGTFKGTFDGGNHTVTIVGVPMFAELSGVAKNLTIVGDDVNITADNSGFGALAAFAPDEVYVENVTNNVNINMTGLGNAAGGIIGQTEGYIKAIFVNCVNNGNVTVTSTTAAGETDTEFWAAGMCGRADTFVAQNCTNNGAVKALSPNCVTGGDGKGYAGGMVGRCAYNAAYNFLDIEFCVNNGEIYGSYTAAGFSGNTGVASNMTKPEYDSMPFTFKANVNYGTITGHVYAGGIAGYIYATGGNDNEIFDVEFNINLGDILGGRYNNTSGAATVGWASDIVAYSNSIKNILCYNIAAGTVGYHGEENTSAPAPTFLGCSSANYEEDETFHDNFIVENTYYEWTTYSTGTADNRHDITWGKAEEKIKVIAADKLATGEVALTINKLAEVNAFYQTIGVDAVPLPLPTSKIVVSDGNGGFKNGDKAPYDVYTANEIVTTEPVVETTAPETTEAPATTAAPGTSKAPDAETTATPGAESTAAPEATTAAPVEEKGCGSVVACGVALVAILGTAYVAKRKF